MATVVKGDQKAPFSIATTQISTLSFPGLLHFTLNPYLIMLSVKQGGIKYHFFSLWYDSTWDWTPFFQTIGDHSNHYANMQQVVTNQLKVVSTEDFQDCVVYTHKHKWKHNQRWFTTSMNERTYFFFKIYLSHFILKRVDVSVVCERWVETGTDCDINTTSSLDHSMLCHLQEPTEHFFCILAGVAQLGVTEGYSPLSASWPLLWPSCLQLT